MLNTKETTHTMQLVVRDRMNSIGPMNFFRTTDTTDTTIWKPGFSFHNNQGGNAALMISVRELTLVSTE